MGRARELSADDPSAIAADFASLLGIAETELLGVIDQMVALRKSLTMGARTREDVYRDATSLKKRADDIGAFVEGLPAPPNLARIHALYAEAALLVVQGAEATLLYFEAPDDRRDGEATLLRVESAKQLTEASKQLKAATARR
jgi:hypothetical protein